MKNLENLNLQELTIDEQVNIDGGFPPAILLLAAFLAGTVLAR